MRRLVLQQRIFKRTKSLSPVVAHLGKQPVFGVEKNFAVGFPDAVVLRPFPAFAVELLGFDPWPFKVQETPLDKELDGGRALQHARRIHTRRHLKIDEVVLVKRIYIAQALSRQQVIYQPVALLNAERIGNFAERIL